MYKSVGVREFVKEFELHGREDQFSTGALYMLFDHLTELEEDYGEQMELDVIAICCEWTEYGSLEEAAIELGYDGDTDDLLRGEIVLYDEYEIVLVQN